jgi:hypothetical protein
MGLSCNRCGARWRGDQGHDWHRDPESGEKGCAELIEEIGHAADHVTELRERFVTFANTAACIPQANRSHEQQVLMSYIRNLTFRPDNVNLSMLLLYIRAGEGVQRKMRELMEELRGAHKLLDEVSAVDLDVS